MAGETQAVSTDVIFWQQLPDQPGPQVLHAGYYRSWCVETGARWQFRPA